MIENRGGRVVFLPPQGKYFNPIELAFGTIKTMIRNSYIISKASDEKRSRSEEEVIDIVNEACHGLKRKQVMKKDQEVKRK